MGDKSNRKTMNRNWCNQKANPALKTKMGNKVEAVQRRAAMWATRDYKYTSSVTAMLKDLNWRPLDQRRVDSRLLMMYRVTYDLVAIPAPEYLVRNT